jgi:SAM-dependent methyltransferase
MAMITRLRNWVYQQRQKQTLLGHGLGAVLKLKRGLASFLLLARNRSTEPGVEVGPFVVDGHLGGYRKGGDPATWYPTLWAWIVNRYHIASVLDVGCGEGHAMKYFKESGCEVLGVEGCQQAIDDTVVPGHVVKHDFCDVAFVSNKQYDLVWSCEFVEHVDEAFVNNILDAFSCARKLLLITHAGPDQIGGYHHVNLKPSSYWIRLIQDRGFVYSGTLTREFRRMAREDSQYDMPNHFAERGLVFCRADLLDR